VSWVVIGSRWFVAIVLGLAALAKAGDRQVLRDAIVRYRVVPASWNPPLAWALPKAESALAVLLALGVLAHIVAPIIAAVLVLFALVVALNLLRGESFECGCGVGLEPRPIGWGLVARDLGLAGLALIVAVEPAPSLSLFAGTHRVSDPSALALLPVPMLVIVLFIIGRLELATHTGRSWLLSRAPRTASRADPERLQSAQLRITTWNGRSPSTTVGS
jgi:hypothetical protein